jgi:hypothetical protein
MKPQPGLHSQHGDYALDDPGLYSRHRHKIVSSLQCPVILLGSHSFLSTGYRGIWYGLKWPGRDADHSRPHTGEVKDERSYISTVPIRLHFVHGANFTICEGSRIWYIKMTCTQDKWLSQIATDSCSLLPVFRSYWVQWISFQALT